MLEKEFGADIGNGYAKYKGGKFLSKIEIGELAEPYGEVHTVKFRGIDYIVGQETGSAVVEEGKYFGDRYLLLLLTAIALTKGIESSSTKANLVIGVPPNEFNKAHRELIKEHLSGIQETIIVDGRKFDILLNKVEVFMEGSVPIKTNEKEKILVIDVGARTINLILWKNQRKVYNYAFEKSFYSLYSEMSYVLNKQYNMKTTPQRVGEYVGVDSINIWGEVSPVPEMKIQLEKFITICTENIQQNDKLESTTCDKVIIIGGGAEKTLPYFKKAFPHAKAIKNSQLINQEVYEAVAKAIYKD